MSRVFDTTTIPRTQTRRAKLCKLCQSFPAEELDRINLELVLRRKTIALLKEECSQYLPEGVEEFSYDNFSNHRKHVNVALILTEYSATEDPSEPRDPIEEGVQQLSVLLHQIQQTQIVDKETVLSFLYEDRLRNIAWLQECLSIARDAYTQIPTVDLQRRIDGLITRLAELESSLTKDILAHLRVEDSSKTNQSLQTVASGTEDILRLMGIRLLSSLGDPVIVKIVLKEVSVGLGKLFAGKDLKDAVDATYQEDSKSDVK